MKTVKVEFDTELWIYVPEAWPWKNFANVDQWATTLGELYVEATEASAEDGAVLAEKLRAIVAQRAPEESRFICMADPFNFLFHVNVLYVDSNKKMPLDDLVFADDPSVVRPVELEQVTSPHLADGVRALRYVEDEDGDVGLFAQYAFRAKGLDVILVAVSYETDNLLAALPAIDTLARSISVVRRGFLQRSLTQEI